MRYRACEATVTNRNLPLTTARFVCRKSFRCLLIPYICMYTACPHVCAAYVSVCAPVEIELLVFTSRCISRWQPVCECAYIYIYIILWLLCVQLPTCLQGLCIYKRPSVVVVTCTYMYVKAVRLNPSQRSAWWGMRCFCSTAIKALHRGLNGIFTDGFYGSQPSCQWAALTPKWWKYDMKSSRCHRRYS